MTTKIDQLKNILTAMKFQQVCPNYDEWRALVASDHNFEDWYLLGYMHGKRAERAKKRK